MALQIPRLRLASTDYKAAAYISMFNGAVEMAAFLNKNDTGIPGPVVKARFSPTSLYKFKMVLNKVADDKDMKPVTIGIFQWQQSTKAFEFRANVTIGRDQEGIVYIELSGDRHKDPIRFNLVLSSGEVHLNGAIPTGVYASEIGAKTIVDFISHQLEPALILTTYDQGNGANRSNSNGTQTNTQSVTVPAPVADDDIPF